MTLSEYDQDPDVLRYAETEDVLVLRDGEPAYRISRIKAPPGESDIANDGDQRQSVV